MTEDSVLPADEENPPPAHQDLRLLAPVATGLLACLNTELDEAGRPVTRAALYHGTTGPPWDDCDCETGARKGQAWVRVVEVRPVSQTAFNSGGKPLGCQVDQWQARFELGVVRCVSMPDDSGTPPTGAEQTADALSAYADAVVLQDATDSCDVLVDRLVSVEAWRPIGPSGGCAGSTLTLLVEL
ncbi:hypothetical protein [Streptomyces sp. TR02-1]|uniref:hypothetical protein n=1 Tax=Streptomyces sp. TR02-1 TaxID=3385977 RepID=UPI0039A2CBE3